MHILVEEMIQLGAIDNYIKCLEINEGFEEVILSFECNNFNKDAECLFKGCYEISLIHDIAYPKKRLPNGKLDCKYYIQNIEIVEVDGLYEFSISAWPLSGRIKCENIIIELRERKLNAYK